MEFTIYSIGDSLFLEQVLIALAMIAGVPDFNDMIKIGLLLGVFSVVISAIAKGGREIEIQHVLLGYIIYATMFIPTARVLIEDSYSGSVRVVDNVPMGAAAAGGIISTIGYKVTQLFEVAYGPVVPHLTDTQFAESLQVLSDMRKKATDPAIWQGINADFGGGFTDVRRSYSNYIRNCTLRKIDLGVMKIDDLYNGNYLTTLEFNSALFTTEVYLQAGNSTGQSRTCAQAWNDLTAIAFGGASTEDALNAALGFDANQLAPGESSITKMTTAADALLASAISANTYLSMAVLEPLLAQAASEKYKEFNDFSGATMINQAIQQRNTEWAAEQTLFMTIVRPMLAFFEAFIYAIAPIMAFVIVLGTKGIQLAGKYFTMLIWIQLWMPLLAIVNLYIHVAARSKFDAYSAIATHNWDSFYALDTTSDLAQHWVATGGLLAASTPAIALMLIYGSAVTATHLAGRLKGGDYINEKIPTPDAVSSKPMHDISSQYSGNMIGGMSLTGVSGAVGSVNYSSAASATTASTNEHVNARSKQWGQELGHTFSANHSNEQVTSNLESLGRSAMASNTQVGNAIQSRAAQYAKDNKIDTSHTEGLAGIAALNASGAATIDVDNAVNAFQKKSGLSTETINGFAGRGNNSGDILRPSANVSASGTMQSKTEDGTSTTSSNRNSTTSGYQFSEADTRSFNQDMAARIAKSTTTSGKEAYQVGDNSNLKELSSELISATEKFSQSENFSAAMGQVSNMKWDELGGIIAGNKTAAASLNNSWNMQPEEVKAKATENYRMMREDFGMSAEQSLHASRLKALLDPNVHGKDTNAQFNAMQKASDVIQTATGNGGDVYGGHHNKNSNIDSTGLQHNEMKEKVEGTVDPNLETNSKNRMETLSTEANQSSTEINGPDMAAIQKQNYTNTDNHSNQAEKTEAQVKQEPLDQAKWNMINNVPEQSFAADATGWASNTTDSIHRGYEKIAGGTSAAITGASDEINNQLENYKNMTPQQQTQFKGDLENEDRSFINAASDSILGAAVNGVEMMSSSEISAATQNMSWEEKGAYWSAAANKSLEGGTESFQQFTQEHGNDYKAAMKEYAENRYGLTPAQADIYAESFDATPEGMQAAMNNLQAPYAIQENGIPQKNEDGTWQLTPEDQKFTQAMASNITAATETGSVAGSYLQNVTNFNTINSNTTFNKNN